MRILTLSNCPLVETQGSGYIICGYARELRARGHHVDLFGPETSEILPQFKARFRRYRLALGILRTALLNIGRGYDIVELYGAESFLAAMALARLPQKNFVLVARTNGLEPCMHEAFIEYEKSLGKAKRGIIDALKDELDALTYKSCDRLVTISQHDYNYALERQLQAPSDILLVENPLASSFLGLPLELERKQNIVFVGNWLERKGTDLIPGAMTQVLREFPDSTLLLVGVGSDPISRMFGTDVQARVNVLPFVQDKAALIGLYRSARILIMPSIYEGFGLVVSEAMACGCAVVSAKTGFSAGLIDREESVLLDPRSEQSLAESVKLLLSDDHLRRSIAAAGYRRVQRLTWDNSTDRIESAYKSWLDKREPISTRD